MIDLVDPVNITNKLLNARDPSQINFQDPADEIFSFLETFTKDESKV